MDDKNPSSFRKSISSGTHWHDDAWRYLELVGELQYYVNWRAWSASRCRLVASALDDQGAPTGSLSEDDSNADTVRQIVNDIAGGVSGQAKLIQRLALLLSVTGECWVGMVVRDAAREETPDGSPLPVDLSRPGFAREQWFVFGKNQISSTSNGIELKLPDGTKHHYDSDFDILFRVWNEHPFDPSLPVSPIWANRVVLHEIVQTTATIDNANNSRLVGNGVWMVPQEMSLPHQVAPVAYPRGETPPADPGPVFEDNSVQALQDLLFDVASTAKRDPESMAAMLPIIVGVPGEFIKQAKDGWIKPSTEVPETALKTREAAIRRLAMGLDTSPERLTGMGGGNHWSSWLADESDVKIHIAPVVELICSALTQEILRFKLAEESIDPAAYVVWYDTTQLTQDPDKTDEARDGFDRGALSARALREHLGFDDEDGYDFETPEGWIELALDKIALDPANAAIFRPILEAAAARVGLEISAPVALPAAPVAEEDDPADAEPPEPATTPDEPPITAAVHTVTRICVNRALELANKRRRTRTNASVFRDVPIELAHTKLPPLPYDDVADLIKGWDTGVRVDDLEAMGIAPDGFRDVVRSVVTMALVSSTQPMIPASALRRSADVPA